MQIFIKGIKCAVKILGVMSYVGICNKIMLGEKCTTVVLALIQIDQKM